jgi:hypothetical protein
MESADVSNLPHCEYEASARRQDKTIVAELSLYGIELGSESVDLMVLENKVSNTRENFRRRRRENIVLAPLAIYL